MSDVTQILSQIEQGDPTASEQLLPLVYQELRRLAAQKMALEKQGQTLQATALVHEAYMRLVDGEHQQRWDSRGHFYSAAAEAMRRILVDNARRKGSQKRGGELNRVDVELGEIHDGKESDNLLEFNEALEKLTSNDPRKADLVKLRFFTGLTTKQAAEVLGVSVATAERDWTFARAWLRREMTNGES